ncbi:MAG TPA: SDR family NAD(P)-dependent oxidoreductase [Streptosporangiaceae bacterium]|nr:SDR family NAD(P)-dependent oxidoreductase [Streptosporangiaceae bacterium]
MRRLDGKVAIVTGAGAGLGRSHALALAAEGATVIVNNRVSRGGRPSAEIVAEEICSLGGRALADTSSVADWAAMGGLVERAVRECGRLDIVVNNAGVLVWEMIADIDEAAYDELMAVNVKGTFALTHHACIHWREAAERGESVSGRIINTVSGIGLFGFARGGVYGASKGAVLSLTNVTAMEMRRYGVTANAIWPEARAGTSKGIFPAAPADPAAFDGYLPENISPLVVYLATDAAGWLTGQVVYIQGDRVRRMEGWSVAGEYHSAAGRALTPAELAEALPHLYGTLPKLQPETGLQDALGGIDPGRESAQAGSPAAPGGDPATG